MQQVQFETSMKNISFGGKKNMCTPLGETGCSTNGIKAELVIHFVSFKA